MTVSELNHVAIHVAAVAPSCDFYQQVLGLAPIPRPAFDFPGAWFRLGVRQELHLLGARNEPVIAGRRSNHFALLVDDITAWEAHLTQCGANFQPQKKRPDGAAQIFLQDPDGHVIELCTAPPPARC